MAGAVAVVASSVIGCLTAKVMSLRRTEAHEEEDGIAAMAVRYPQGQIPMRRQWGAVTALRTTATHFSDPPLVMCWRAAVHETLTAGVPATAGETTIGGEWIAKRLHDAKSRFHIMQTFSHMMFSSMAPARLCFKFQRELGRLFRAQEVFVYLKLDNKPPVSVSSPNPCCVYNYRVSILDTEAGKLLATISQPVRSATQVVMREGKVLALSATNTHPDVELLPGEDTVLAVPIFMPNNEKGSFSSMSFISDDGLYGCVEVSTLPMPSLYQLRASISFRRARAHAVFWTGGW